MVRIYRVMDRALASQDKAIAEVSAALASGALALLPTETVYGIGVSVRAHAANCDDGAVGRDVGTAPARVNGAAAPSEQTGYGRIFTLKQRELTQTVPLLVEGPEALDRYGIEVPQAIRDAARVFWPGALTLVIPASSEVPAYMRAADGTVALRASASPVIRALVRACDSPLAVTSANTHGKPAPASFEEVEPRILHGVDVAIDAGTTPCRDASTILAVRDGRAVVLRQGALAADRLREVVGPLEVA